MMSPSKKSSIQSFTYVLWEFQTLEILRHFSMMLFNDIWYLQYLGGCQNPVTVGKSPIHCIIIIFIFIIIFITFSSFEGPIILVHIRNLWCVSVPENIGIKAKDQKSTVRVFRQGPKYIQFSLKSKFNMEPGAHFQAQDPIAAELATDLYMVTWI